MSEKAKPVRRRQRDLELTSEICGELSGKVFLRSSLGTRRTYVSGLATEAVLLSDFAESVRKRCEKIAPREQALLEQLLFAGESDHYTALLPADAHPGKRLRTWQCFYELEMDAAQTYVSRFFPGTHFYPVRPFPRVRPDDDLVIIGSQVSNSATRAFLGPSQRKDPVFRIARRGWRTELSWNLVTPERAPLTAITEFGGRRDSYAHVIHERGNPVPYESRRDPSGTRYLDDYLLVTMLPRRKGRRQRVLIFSGLHGAGNRTLDLILREPPISLLEKAAGQIAGAPFYQMMLCVQTVPDERGESFPCCPELIEARPLVLE